MPSDLLKSKAFDDVLTDEISDTTTLETWAAWRGLEDFLMFYPEYLCKQPSLVTLQKFYVFLRAPPICFS